MLIWLRYIHGIIVFRDPKILKVMCACDFYFPLSQRHPLTRRRLRRLFFTLRQEFTLIEKNPKNLIRITIGKEIIVTFP